MKLTKKKAKSLLVLALIGSVVGSHYISYKWGKSLDLAHYESLATEEAIETDDKLSVGKSRAQELFELLPLKCRLAEGATFAVGMYKDQAMYALEFQHPTEPKLEYLQLKQKNIKGRGYELTANNYKNHLNVSVDYEVTEYNQLYLKLNWVKYISDKHSYSGNTVLCSS